jgi:hypothetical protein
MRTVREYHDAALDAIDRATSPAADMAHRTHHLAEAAVYAELAKTADHVQEVTT